jgi:hypothetical protein
MLEQVLEGTWQEIARHAGELAGLINKFIGKNKLVLIR